MVAIEADRLVVASVTDVARYYLALACEDGDLISNLKMQKLVYYAYAWTLVGTGKRLFGEPIQAWANGPVVYTLYQQLREYGARPIDPAFLGDMAGETEANYEKVAEQLAVTFPEDVLDTLNNVYEQYMPLAAFQLVALTHSEKPWREARKGLRPGDRCERSVDDADIWEQFGQS